jgi:glycosyltransferase involved in cell wall biosynthesis
MVSRDNDAPLLIDVSRLVWRRWSGTRATGIDRICMAWLEHYGPQSQAVIVHRHAKAILPKRTSQVLFRLLLRADRSKRDVAQFRRDVIGLGLWQGKHLRDRLPGRGRLWLNAGHTGLDIEGLEEWCHRRELRPVYLVHDLIPITHPEFCREGEELRHRQRMGTVSRTAAGVVANSQHTLDEYKEFCRRENTAVAPAVVAWPGTPQLPLSRTDGSSDARFVVLGTIEGRKNHLLLLSIWQDFLAQRNQGHGEWKVPELLIVGRRGWQADAVFDMLDNFDFEGRVRELGPLDDTALAAVLKGARALLFPSFTEGFGIPLVESLAAGVPVLASDLPVFREIGQEIPDFLPPDDRDAWRSAILEFARPVSARRTHQIERITRFEAPSWEGHFRHVDHLIASLTA